MFDVFEYTIFQLLLWNFSKSVIEMNYTLKSHGSMVFISWRFLNWTMELEEAFTYSCSQEL